MSKKSEQARRARLLEVATHFANGGRAVAKDRADDAIKESAIKTKIQLYEM